MFHLRFLFSFYCLFVFICPVFLLVLLCSRTQYADISLADTWHLNLRFSFMFLVFLCLTVCDHIIRMYVSRIRESGRTLGVLMKLGRKVDLMWRQHVDQHRKRVLKQMAGTFKIQTFYWNFEVNHLNHRSWKEKEKKMCEDSKWDEQQKY